MKPFKPLFAFAVLAFLLGCEDPQPTATCVDGVQNGSEDGVDCGGDCPPCLSTFTIAGNVQKGPFLNGSSVLASALDSNLTPLGGTFNTQILDNSGYFGFNNLQLPFSFVSLRADGFYFNEVCGEQSAAQITLNAVLDLTSAGPANVNTITHLEKARIEYLVAGGMDFTSAKAKAMNEVLAIFEIDTTQNFPPSQLLDIANSSYADGVLIAITSILQGYRSVSEFSDLMANITTDIRMDGTLDSPSLGAKLRAHALVLDTNAIKQNIVDRYLDLGITVSVPNFGQHITNYLLNTNHTGGEDVIDYPETGLSGANFLNETDTVFTEFQFYSLAAKRPNDCVDLAVKISRYSSSCTNCWYYNFGSGQNWAVSSYDATTFSQTYTSLGLDADISIGFYAGTFKLEFFLNGSSTPYRTKFITVN
jgi:hypothetical protein